jgi:hypothetical protein
MYGFHRQGTLLVVTSIPRVLLELIWTTRNTQEEMAKALAKFKFRRLGKHFHGTK